MAHVEPTTPWFERKILVGFLLVLFFPLGLWGLWRSSSFSKIAKIVLSSIVGLIVIAAANTPSKDSLDDDKSGQGTMSGAELTPRESQSVQATVEGKTLDDLNQLKMGSDEWSQLHRLLVVEAENPHPVGEKFEKGPETDIREELWSVQVREFSYWLSGHPVAEFVQSVHLESDSVCGDWQVVFVCRENPSLSPITKCAFMLRLNHDWNDKNRLGFNQGIAVAVNGSIIERWTGADYLAFVRQETGEQPRFPQLSDEDGSTMAEREIIYDAFNQNLAAWSEKSKAFWNNMRREAGLPEKQ